MVLPRGRVVVVSHPRFDAPTQPGHPGARPRERHGFTASGAVLLVMALVSLFCSALPGAWVHGTGSGDGEGEGDIGVVKIYVRGLFEGAFITLAVVLLAGSLACFAVALVRRVRAR